MNLYGATDRRQIQFDFLLHVPDGEYEAEAKAMGARLFYTPNNSSGLWQAHKANDNFFRTHAKEYCAVHLHASSLTEILPLFYAWRYGIPVRILHSHSSAINRAHSSFWLRMAMHWLMKPWVHTVATHYFGCSDKAIDWLFRYTGVRAKAQMMKNGIPAEKYAFNTEKRHKVRTALNIAQNELVVSHTGTFLQVKNHTFILDIFAALLRTISDAKLLLVGDGPLRTDIEAKIHALGLQQHVILAGVRSDVHNLLAASDVHLMPSLYEGLPVSLVEAQAAGLPLVIADTISRDAALTANVEFLPLTAPADYWAGRLLAAAKKGRNRNATTEIQLAGYDIMQTAEKITKVYLSTKL